MQLRRFDGRRRSFAFNPFAGLGETAPDGSEKGISRREVSFFESIAARKTSTYRAPIQLNVDLLVIPGTVLGNVTEPNFVLFPMWRLILPRAAVRGVRSLG